MKTLVQIHDTLTNELRLTIANQIRGRRTALGWTQGDLARRADVPGGRQAVYRYEKGIHVPHVGVLEIIENVLAGGEDDYRNFRDAVEYSKECGKEAARQYGGDVPEWEVDFPFPADVEEIESILNRSYDDLDIDESDAIEDAWISGYDQIRSATVV